TDRDAVRVPEAFLRRVVTRLCLDQLKSARHRRETYIGPWLPEPVVEAADDEIDDITLPLMMALERLLPLETRRLSFFTTWPAPAPRNAPRPSIATPRRAGSLPAAREVTFARRGRAFKCPGNAALRSPLRSSRLPAVATCNSYDRCSRRISPPMPTVAARRGRPRSRPSGSITSCKSMLHWRRSLPSTSHGSCATASSTACQASSPSSRTIRCKPPRCR